MKQKQPWRIRGDVINIEKKSIGNSILQKTSKNYEKKFWQEVISQANLVKANDFLKQYKVNKIKQLVVLLRDDHEILTHYEIKNITQ